MTDSSGRSPACRIVADEGKTGTLNQCIGLAAALGLEPEIVPVRLRQPWRALAPRVTAGLALGDAGRALARPWPDLLIAGGRRSAAVARWFADRKPPRPLVVQLQDPRIDARHFDLVIAPRHDAVRGATVVETLGALHPTTVARLAEARAVAPAYLLELPAPRVAVLVGGASRVHPFGEADRSRLVHAVETIARDGAAPMITLSRRSPAGLADRLRAAIGERPGHVHDGREGGSGANPYLPMLALADAFLVTADSVSMISEAAITGRPIHVLPLEGEGRRLDRFHAGMEEAGIARRFAGRIEAWSYDPPDDMAVAVAAVRSALSRQSVQARNAS